MNVSAMIDCVNSKLSGSSKMRESGDLKIRIPAPAVIASKASIHISTFRDISSTLNTRNENILTAKFTF